MAFKSNTKTNLGLVGSPSTLSSTVSVGQTHTIIGLSVSNTVETNITVSVKFNKQGGDSCFIIKNATILPGGAIVVAGGDQKLVLEAGDTITAYCSAANSSDAIMSYLA